jgi:PepSY-associated TM region
LDTQDQPRVDEDSEHDDHDEARREDKRKFGTKREHGERRGLARALSSDELLSLDPLVEVAKSKMPGWHNIRMRLGGESARLVTFMFDDGEESEGKGKRSQLLMDRLSGEVLEWTPPDQAPKGQRWRAFARFLHTGEAFGLPGQIVAFIAALATLLLLVTGLALSVRRFFSWKTRTARHNPAAQGYAAQKYPRLRRAFSSSPAQKIEADLSPTTRRESLE